MLPSPSDLTYFMEIAQHGNLTHAAQRLGVSQPSLTLAVQRLENSVGTSVLIRSRQGVKLTKAGEKLLLETRRLLGDWEILKQQALSAMNEVQGHFRLGCHASVARYALPVFLPKLLQEHPELELTLHHQLSRQVTRQVLDLELDIGIAVNVTPHPDLVMKSLAKDEVTLWKSARSKNDDVLLCEPSLLQTQAIMRKLKSSGFTFRRTLESSNLEVIASLVECGAGVGVLPKRVARAQSADLIQVKGAPVFQDEISLLYRIENKNVRAIQALSRAIQDGFAEGRRA